MPNDQRLSRLPSDWLGWLASYTVTPVETGMSTASLYRMHGGAGHDLYLKIEAGFEAGELRAEIARTMWLGAAGFRVPALVRTFDDGALVAATMTALQGVHPQDCALPARQVVDILARAMAVLHSYPARDCPFDETIATRLARARELIARDLIEPEHFAERNLGLDPRQIHDRLAASVPPAEDPVLVHGDARFDNMLIDAKGELGFIDCGHSGLGDRYIDLVGLVEDIEEYFGAEWIKPFLAAYGAVSWDADKARFFSDLYELY
jgi:aminoglycoside 3'-phosphotransferase-2